MANNRVVLPLENLSSHWPALWKGLRVGAVLHPASIGPDLRHSLEYLLEQKEGLFELRALFGPQHGIYGQTQDNMIEWEGFEDPRLKIPVYSLYGEHREPTAERLADLDILLIDLQDVGARYYTFIWTMFLVMKAAQREQKKVIVLDRPNPLGNTVEGPLLDDDFQSFVGLHRIPIRHGKTIGELALQFQREVFPELALEVFPMKNYDPAGYFDMTALPWVAPSPNMPTLDTAIVYPGMCLLEATNLSEGRGTTRPFEWFGAPYLNGEKLCHYLNSLEMPGVYFRPMYFEPTFHKWKGELCQGAQIHVLDREVYQPVRVGLEILRYCFHTHEEFSWRTEPYEYEYSKLAIDILLGSTQLRKELIEETPL